MEGKVVELAGEMEAQGREMQHILHSQATSETQLQQSYSILDALKTDNFILTRQLRNVKVV